MFKFFVFCCLFFHIFSQILGQNDETSTDTKPPNLSLVSIHQKKDLAESGFLADLPGQYNFHASNIIFNLNGPLPAKWSMGLSNNLVNVDKNLGSDYVVTAGIGAHKLHRRKLPWSKARKMCNEEGGHLAIIRSNSEEKIILQTMVQDSIDDAWIGLHDRFEEGEWISVLDEPLGETGWAKWSAKINPNPDNHAGKQHCARLLKDGGGMDDDNCDIAKSFVCKISKF